MLDTFQVVLKGNLHTVERVADNKDEYYKVWMGNGNLQYEIYSKKQVEEFINNRTWERVFTEKEVCKLLIEYKTYVDELLKGLQEKIGELKAEIDRLRDF